MALREPYQTWAEEFRVLGLTGGKDEVKTLALMQEILADHGIEVAQELEALGKRETSYSGAKQNLTTALALFAGEYVRVRDEEIPDRDSWTDDYHTILGLANDILRDANSLLHNLSEDEIEKYVTQSTLIQLRFAIRH